MPFASRPFPLCETEYPKTLNRKLCIHPDLAQLHAFAYVLYIRRNFVFCKNIYRVHIFPPMPCTGSTPALESMTLSSLAVVALPAYRCDPVQNTETGILGKEWGFFHMKETHFWHKLLCFVLV
jgi:hypothetical protein